MRTLQSLRGFAGRLRAAGSDLVLSLLRRERLGFGSGFGVIGDVNTSGVEVDARTVLSIAAARRCVNVIAGDLASMPLNLVQEVDGAEIPVKDHPRKMLFRRSPDNGDSTPARWRQALIGNTLAWGNGYAEIVPSNDRRGVFLYLLKPWSVAVHEEEGRIGYRVDGKPLERDSTLHVAGLGCDGIRGYPPFLLHPQAFGLTVAAERFGGSFLGNGAFPSGFVTVPDEMGEENYRRFLASFAAGISGSDKVGKLGILPPGVGFVKGTVDPNVAQFVETRQFQILEICRIFGVPPHKVMDFSRAHYSTIEASNLEYSQTTLLPWARLFEESLNLRLLTGAEIEAGYTFRHDFSAFLRADASGRANLYRTLFHIGAINPNEVRAKEGYAPRDGGDEYFVPLNMAGSEGASDKPAEPTNGGNP